MPLFSAWLAIVGRVVLHWCVNIEMLSMILT